jgi:DNA-binding FadR family transcriptional regulator
MAKDDPANADLTPAARRAFGTGRRLHGAIATKLGVAIVSGEYAPGDTLSGEVAFSEALNVSRTAYREAVQVLAAKGLVESRPKTGTKVLPKDRWNVLDPDVLAWSFANAPDIDFIRNLFELRSIIEPAAAGLAAERRDRDDLKQMKESLSAMRRHTLSSDEGQSADREFHTAILRATRNSALIFLSSGIGAAVRWTTQFKQRSSGLPRNAIPEHARVYEAIAAGDAREASEAMRILVDLALDDTRVALNK